MRSSQSARSQMPGSRSTQRPCVSAMSSAPGVKTSKTKRPPGARCFAHRAQGGAPVGVGLHVEERAERDRHEREPALDRRVADVAVAQVERDPGELGLFARHLEHAGRQVDADHVDPVRRDRHGDAAGADAELEHRPAGGERLLEIELHVLDDAPHPRVVEPGDRVVAGHAAILPAMYARATTLFSRPRCAPGRPARHAA